MQSNRSRARSVLLAHERVRLDGEIRMSSNRAFGISLCALLAIIGVTQSWRSGGVRWPWLGASGAALAIALFAPGLLGPLHRVWVAAAQILHRVINPVLMAVLYFGLLTPVAALMRIFGRRALELNMTSGPDASYWMPRDTATGSMKAPF